MALSGPESYLRRLSSAILATAIIAIISYTSFAALQGEHGLFRLFQIKAQESRLTEDLEGVRQERLIMANKTRRLSTEQLDIDLLDEQSRRVLGLGRNDEILIR